MGKLKLTPLNQASDRVAKALACELLDSGVEDQSCLPTAICILGVIQRGIDSGKPEDIIEALKQHWQQDVKLWETHHKGKNKRHVERLKGFLESEEF